MMYVSAVPVAVSMRASNLARRRPGAGRAIASEARRMLQSDLFWLLCPWLVLSCSEERALAAGAPGVSPFSLLFEVASALGTVGLSLGTPGAVTSLSASLSGFGQARDAAVKAQAPSRAAAALRHPTPPTRARPSQPACARTKNPLPPPPPPPRSG